MGVENESGGGKCLHPAVLGAAESALEDCDLMLVVGTSAGTHVVAGRFVELPRNMRTTLP